MICDWSKTRGCTHVKFTIAATWSIAPFKRFWDIAFMTNNSISFSGNLVSFAISLNVNCLKWAGRLNAIFDKIQSDQLKTWLDLQLTSSKQSRHIFTRNLPSCCWRSPIDDHFGFIFSNLSMSPLLNAITNFINHSFSVFFNASTMGCASYFFLNLTYNGKGYLRLRHVIWLWLRFA